MKDKEKTKPTKKRIIMYYLVLAACLLIIAAIVVGVVYAVNNTGNTNNLTIDNPDSPNEPDAPADNPDDKNNDGGDDVQDTSSQYEFIVPIATVNVTQAHTFWHDSTMDWYCLHQGMDFTAEAGTEVYAAIDGTVKAITTDDVFYGATVTISHADGVETVYKYVNPVDGLKVGDAVSRGDVIATVAEATGAEITEGSHLHFEVFVNGAMADPDDYLDVVQK